MDRGVAGIAVGPKVVLMGNRQAATLAVTSFSKSG